MATTKNNAIGDKEMLTKVHETRNAVSKYFEARWARSVENARFFRMDQYSDEQLQKFDKGNRVPYVLDYMTNPVNVLLGTQRDTRTDIA